MCALEKNVHFGTVEWHDLYMSVSPFDIKCSSNLVFPYLLYVWMMYSLMKVGH